MVIFLNVSKTLTCSKPFLHIASTWGFHDNLLSIVIPNAVDLVVKEIIDCECGHFFYLYISHSRRSPVKVNLAIKMIIQSQSHILYCLLI